MIWAAHFRPQWTLYQLLACGTDAFSQTPMMVSFEAFWGAALKGWKLDMPWDDKNKGSSCHQGFLFSLFSAFFWSWKSLKVTKVTKRKSKPFLDGKCLAPKNKVHLQVKSMQGGIEWDGIMPLSHPSSKDLGTFLLALAWHIWWHKESHDDQRIPQYELAPVVSKKAQEKIFRLSLNKEPANFGHTSHKLFLNLVSCALPLSKAFLTTCNNHSCLEFHAFEPTKTPRFCCIS